MFKVISGAKGILRTLTIDQRKATLIQGMSQNHTAETSNVT